MSRFGNGLTSVSEIHLFPGMNLTLDCEVVFSVSKDCVLTFEDLAKAKKAFSRSIHRSLEKK